MKSSRSKKKTKKKPSTVLSKRKRPDFNWLEENMIYDSERDKSLQDLLKVTDSDKQLKELAETAGDIFLKKQCIDYEQVHANLIGNKLIPIHNEYIEKYGSQWIDKDFIINECISVCVNLPPKRKVIHVEMCVEFIKHLSSLHEETKKLKKLKKMFFLRNYPVRDLKYFHHVVNDTDNKWKNNKKYFIYEMGYNVQRVAALAACFSSINETLIEKFKDFNNKSRIDIMTDNFIAKEIEDRDFERINQYWDAVAINDLKDLNNLEDIDLQEWKLIEDFLQ